MTTINRSRPATVVRRSKTDVAAEYYDVPATDESRVSWSSGWTTAAGVSHASTAPGSRPGDRTLPLTDVRRLSDRTCPNAQTTRSSATAETARDADVVRAHSQGPKCILNVVIK